MGGLLGVGDRVGTVANAFVAHDANGNAAGLRWVPDGTMAARCEDGPFTEPLRG